MYVVFKQGMSETLLYMKWIELHDIESCNLTFSGCQFEPWFGSRYIEEDISSSLMNIWQDPPEIDVSLHLPSKNEFIPSDFSIHADSLLNNLANVSSPRCILDEPLMKLWYKLDDTFKLPRANTCFRINLKGGYDNVKNCVLTELFIHLLKDQLNEIIYQVSSSTFMSNINDWSY